MKFECKHNVEKMDSIKSILPCLAESFNYIEETPEKSFSLVFKKILNFAQMELLRITDNESFSKTQNPAELVEYLITNNPDLNFEQAEKKFLKL